MGEAGHRQRLLEASVEISRVVRARGIRVHTVDSVLAELVTISARALGVARASVWRVDGEQLRRVVLHSVPHETASEARSDEPTHISLPNAVDALTGREGRIRISTQVAEDVRGVRGVALTVEDTGAGIEPRLRGAIFDPFVTTKDSRGTGIGLATIKRIVDRCHGTIDVHSRVGEGTSFRIWIPALSGG